MLESHEREIITEGKEAGAEVMDVDQIVSLNYGISYR